MNILPQNFVARALLLLDDGWLLRGRDTKNMSLKTRIWGDNNATPQDMPHRCEDK
jgi:hypothetical protein